MGVFLEDGDPLAQWVWVLPGEVVGGVGGFPMI